MLADPLALKILDGDIQPGDHIVADLAESGEMTFQAVPAIAS
jgi:hypothetical protein